jgi:hypothetical protein
MIAFIRATTGSVIGEYCTPAGYRAAAPGSLGEGASCSPASGGASEEAASSVLTGLASFPVRLDTGAFGPVEVGVAPPVEGESSTIASEAQATSKTEEATTDVKLLMK